MTITLTREQKLCLVVMFAAAAQESQRKWGVPSSITIAQAILESAWGQSKLAIECNNYFGIKARKHLLPGEEYQEFPTREVRNGKNEIELARFQKFKSIPDCFQRHGELLSCSDRYAPAMEVADDPAKFAIQLLGCGYSTDPKYPKLLGDLIRQYKLTRFDLPPDPPAAKKEAAA
jgi:flagellum-specific peptidoglycan hydrolase FlgJ